MKNGDLTKMEATTRSDGKKITGQGIYLMNIPNKYHEQILKALGTAYTNGRNDVRKELRNLIGAASVLELDYD